MRFRIVDVEHRRALRELFQRVFYLVRRPRLVAPDNFAFARRAHDLKARRKLIELAVCFDRVQDAFHKLIRRYCAVRVQIRQQILQKALDRVLRHGKLSAGDVDEVGEIAGQKLRIELQNRGRAVLSVRAGACDDLAVLGIVQHFDAVPVVFPVEFCDLLAKRLARRQRRKRQNGLFRECRGINPLQIIELVGGIYAAALRAQKHAECSVFFRVQACQFRRVQVAVEKIQNFLTLLGVQVVAVDRAVVEVIKGLPVSVWENVPRVDGNKDILAPREGFRVDWPEVHAARVGVE